jgi:hypothetical protein
MKANKLLFTLGAPKQDSEIVASPADAPAPAPAPSWLSNWSFIPKDPMVGAVKPKSDSTKESQPASSTSAPARFGPVQPAWLMER